MPLRILIVDDNDGNLLLLTKILELEGYLVDSAHNGIEALQSVMQHTPDLAVLDIMMPEMNGYELCQKLRQPPFSATFPIVMLTAMNSNYEQKKARDAGADDVWSKPFDMDRFRSQISARLLTGSQQG